MPAVSSIIGGIGAAVGGIGALFGGGGGDSDTGSAYLQAAAMQANSAEQARQQQMKMYEQARADVAPWRTAGDTALTQLGGLYNLPGYEPVDPTKTLEATPGYLWAKRQGEERTDRSAAGRGLALSGAQQKGLTDYGQNLALEKAWNPYITQLNTMSGQGLTAGSLSGNWAMNTGQQQAGLIQAGGQAQAQGVVNSAIADQLAKNNQMAMYGAMGGYGMNALGGTNLSGVGNWFNNLVGGSDNSFNYPQNMSYSGGGDTGNYFNAFSALI